MKIPFWIVNAFSSHVFSGNPAAVCLLSEWLPNTMLQNIATQHNLSETAFLLGDDSRYELRWFTPTKEVDLCGHATLAAASVIHQIESVYHIHFSTHSGILTAEIIQDSIQLNFPSDRPRPISVSYDYMHLLGIQPIEALQTSSDLLLVFQTQTQIEELKPNMEALSLLPYRGIIVTAKGDMCDFVSRFFAPQSGIPEDPVTGSSHTALTPYWSNILQKNVLEAQQLSARGGFLLVENHVDRVLLSGNVHIYAEGYIHI